MELKKYQFLDSGNMFKSGIYLSDSWQLDYKYLLKNAYSSHNSTIQLERDYKIMWKRIFMNTKVESVMDDKTIA